MYHFLRVFIVLLMKKNTLVKLYSIKEISAGLELPARTRNNSKIMII